MSYVERTLGKQPSDPAQSFKRPRAKVCSHSCPKANRFELDQRSLFFLGGLPHYAHVAYEETLAKLEGIQAAQSGTTESSKTAVHTAKSENPLCESHARAQSRLKV